MIGPFMTRRRLLAGASAATVALGGASSLPAETAPEKPEKVDGKRVTLLHFTDSHAQLETHLDYLPGRPRMACRRRPRASRADDRPCRIRVSHDPIKAAPYGVRGVLASFQFRGLALGIYRRATRMGARRFQR